MMIENKKKPNPIDIHSAAVFVCDARCSNESGKTGESLGITFQQIQKYEKGTNRLEPAVFRTFRRF